VASKIPIHSPVSPSLYSFRERGVASCGYIEPPTSAGTRSRLNFRNLSFTSQLGLWILSTRGVDCPLIFPIYGELPLCIIPSSLRAEFPTRDDSSRLRGTPSLAKHGAMHSGQYHQLTRSWNQADHQHWISKGLTLRLDFHHLIPQALDMCAIVYQLVMKHFDSCERA